VEIALVLAARIGGSRGSCWNIGRPPMSCSASRPECDVVFLPRDERAANVGDFSPPYLQSEYTMLVPAGSSIRSIADADKPGTRILAVRSHSSTMTLTSAIKQAEVILGENELDAFELLRARQADAFASTHQYLLRASKNLAGSRVLADYYGANLNRVYLSSGMIRGVGPVYATALALDRSRQGLAVGRAAYWSCPCRKPGRRDPARTARVH
jgi:ABC-type amino acid transport substrate-binding protein